VGHEIGVAVANTVGGLEVLDDFAVLLGAGGAGAIEPFTLGHPRVGLEVGDHGENLVVG